MRDGERERETIPTSVSSHRGTVGQGFASLLVSSCVAQGQGEREGGVVAKDRAHRWDMNL